MSLFFNYKYKISEVVVKLKNQKVKPAIFHLSLCCLHYFEKYTTKCCRSSSIALHQTLDLLGECWAIPYHSSYTSIYIKWIFENCALKSDCKLFPRRFKLHYYEYVTDFIIFQEIPFLYLLQTPWHKDDLPHYPTLPSPPVPTTTLCYCSHVC